MKCPKCNSENVQIQVKEIKPNTTGACCLAFGGFGLMFFGIIGAIIGLVIGVVVGIVLDSVMSNTYQSVMVCQDCGYVLQPTKQPITKTDEETHTDKERQINKETMSHPLLCAMEESNLVISRTSSSTGSLCSIEVTLDGVAPFEIKDGETKYLKVEQGEHQVTYQQVNGMGKDLRKGSVNISVSEDKHLICLKMLPKGLDVFVR